MTTDQQSVVFPIDPSLKPVPTDDFLPLTESEASNAKGMSGGAKFWLWVGICVLIGTITKSFGVGVTVATISAVVMAFAVKNSNIEKMRREKAERQKTNVVHENEVTVKRSTDEAKSLTSALTRTYDSSAKLAFDLPRHLENATKWLSKAEAEFKDNAFAPFWDAIEGAAQHMASFNDKAKQLTRNADDYYKGLNGKKHTFPIFPVDTKTVPDASPTIRQMARVIRMGQTNYQFAAIWEHRRTREVLIAGFHTLGEAVNNLGATIDSSLSSLQSSLSSDLARIAKEQISTREALDSRLLDQNRMLDNLQHGRKPSAGDTPAQY